MISPLSLPLSLSEKQIFFLIDSDARINIACGAVRSGKTHIAIQKFIKLSKQMPPGNAMITGVSRESLQRNILIDLCEAIGSSPIGSKSNEMTLFGRRVFIIGAHDEGAVRKIKGSTLILGLADECAELPAPFWKMLLSRLSKNGAQLLATCNPEGPAHWLKKEFIDRSDQLDLKHWHFELDDNPSLSEEYKDNLKKEYTGMWYARYILGQWAVAHGLIYSGFDSTNIYTDEPDNPDYYIAGIDYGSANPTAGCLIACSPKRWPQLRVIDTYYYDSVKEGRGKTDAELADALEEWLKPYNVNRLYIDPSAASLKLELGHREMPVSIALNTNNDVLPGIQIVSKFISGKNLVINKSCINLIEEIQTYAWDPKAADRGEDRPIKRDDHLCFVAGTMIATDYGEKPIQDMKIGDRVLTRSGYNRVVATMCSDSDDIWELRAGDRTLVGTGDHPVHINNMMVPLKEIFGYNKVLCLTNETQCLGSHKPHNLMESYIADTCSKRAKNISTTTALSEKTISISKYFCIETFGRTIMDQFRRIFTSITRMETFVITHLKIWNAFLVGNTQKGIQKTYVSSKIKHYKLDKHQNLNIKEEKLQKNGGKHKSQQSEFVDGAAKSINLDLLEVHSFAVRDAETWNGEFLKNSITIKTVNCVVKCLKPTNIEIADFAQESVQLSSDNPIKLKKQTVYNIEVEGEHEYFANGILVGNCDALRYVIASAFPTATFSEPDQDLSIEAIRRRAYGESASMSPFFEGSGMYR